MKNHEVWEPDFESAQDMFAFDEGFELGLEALESDAHGKMTFEKAITDAKLKIIAENPDNLKVVTNPAFDEGINKSRRDAIAEIS